ncbi:unnamed protein product [Dibothriocephalus latus]|uniref:Tektin n=1 Tax=Dibothriocephalus latus TaxID=60516 RepID=A0A3P7L8W0_DIBLA|nr:unnamed protein product [Dibothriocephalus latus]
MDTADKRAAEKIDVDAAELSQFSRQLGSYHATELMGTCQWKLGVAMPNFQYLVLPTPTLSCTVPLTWKEFTKANCEKSKKYRQASTKLREEAVWYSRTVVDALARRWAEASAALSARIREVTMAKCEIGASLEQVMAEIAEVESNIAMLRKSIADKEEPRRIAETRLSLRLNRKRYENCQDSAYTSLTQSPKVPGSNLGAANPEFGYDWLMTANKPEMAIPVQLAKVPGSNLGGANPREQ